MPSGGKIIIENYEDSGFENGKRDSGLRGREENAMKGFRRWLGLLLVLLACLTACGSTGKNSTEAPAETEKETERVSAGPEGTDDSVAVNPKGTLTIGFVMIGSESDWRIACNRSVEEAFARENEYYLLMRDGQQKQ